MQSSKPKIRPESSSDFIEIPDEDELSYAVGTLQNNTMAHS
jgi:hypothetical protein